MIRKDLTYPIKKAVTSIIIGELILLFFVLLGAFLIDVSENTSNDHLTFRYPKLLFLHAISLLIQVVYVVNLKSVNNITSKASLASRFSFFQPISFQKSITKYFSVRLTWFFLVFTLAQPFYGVQKVKAKVNSMELVVALDISNSMNTKDIDKIDTRLEISKRALNQLLNSFSGEKIGMVIFAGSSYVQLPLTSDYSAAKMFIDEVNTSMISNQGTNIANAFETSMDMFSEDKIAKNILLVTDGENHEANPSTIYQAVKEKGIGLSVVGIGTLHGGLIPNNPKRPELGYKLDDTGKPILSKLNKQFIQSIANESNGLAMICSTSYPNFRELVNAFKQKSLDHLSEVEFKIEKSKYQYPLIIAIIFWILFLCLNSSISFPSINRLRK